MHSSKLWIEIDSSFISKSKSFFKFIFENDFSLWMFLIMCFLNFWFDLILSRVYIPRESRDEAKYTIQRDNPLCVYKRTASWSEFKPEMAQALKDLEKNEKSEIQMKIATLDFQQENQDDKNLIKFLIIILTVIFVVCLITLNLLALMIPSRL